MNQQAAPVLKAERRTAIAQMVAQEGSVRVKELADRFGVDVSTVRRDLTMLEKKGALRRVHGGAVAFDEVSAPGDAVLAGTPAARIGQAVAEMLQGGETVFFGPGRLPLAAARSLETHLQLTIVTNSVEVAHWVAANTSHTLIVTGGQAEGGDGGLVGQLTRKALANLRADRVCVELGGISAVGGLTDDNLPQAEITQALLEIGSEVVALVPVERVGRVAAAYIGPVTDVDIVVTGREAPSAFLWDLSESGVHVVLA